MQSGKFRPESNVNCNEEKPPENVYVAYIEFWFVVSIINTCEV